MSDSTPDRRYLLTVAYDGTSYHGWQRQINPDTQQPLRTVQGVLEDALRRALRQPITLAGASRTDAGVHALGQAAAFNAQTTIPLERLPAAVNRYLPDDVLVTAARTVPADFNPIADATRKQYRYAIHNDSLRPLFERRYLYHCWLTLDLAAMHTAAQHLLGTHDFTSLAHAQHGRESAVRTIFDASVSRITDTRIHIDVTGDGFLYNMVRIIAGTLVDVGAGRIAPDSIPDLLQQRDRTAAGPTLAPHGLCLLWIHYDLPDAADDDKEIASPD